MTWNKPSLVLSMEQYSFKAVFSLFFFKWPRSFCQIIYLLILQVNPIGTGTGKYGKRRLFTAKQKHASLVPLLGLMKYEDVYGDDAGKHSRET